MELVTLLTVAIAEGLSQAGVKLLEKVLVPPALEPMAEILERRIQRDYRQAEKDKALTDAIHDALKKAGAPADDPDKFARWFRNRALYHLTDKHNAALRSQVARALLSFTDPKADPPEDLIVALRWPTEQKHELATLLRSIRAQLVTLDNWQALIQYADHAAQLDLLHNILDRLAELDNLVVYAKSIPVGDVGLTEEEAVAIEARYRKEIVKKLRWHILRGIVQVKRAPRLPLADIYLELGLFVQDDEEELQRARKRLLALTEMERMAKEERRLREWVTDAPSRAPRLVILGGPGSGKTLSLRFITLMLAHGYGATRLGLDTPYIPLLVRLTDYAQALKDNSTLSLYNYFLDYIDKAYESHPRLSDFWRLAMEKGACMVLLDGLDEVRDDPISGRSLRTQVIERVQGFADNWCDEERRNQLVVASRIEGYWDEQLQDFAHVELSPLRLPDEVEALLFRWYKAHELTYEPDAALAEQRARERVNELLPWVLEWPGVRRLATNPLLLTILALVHENVGKLPNRRIRLYEICAQTLIESWRQAQTGMHSALLAEIGEETVIRVMAPLAYWLHQKHPSGVASLDEWKEQLTDILHREGFEKDAQELTRRFLHYAHHVAGLLAERGIGQFGFFHLTFEEYLAAREIARQRESERREMLRAHWEDPHWQEVILLAAGQLGIIEARQDDASDFVENLLKMEPHASDNAGRQAVLAGRILADTGLRSVTNQTRRWALQALEETMKDWDPDAKRPRVSSHLSMHTRYNAGEVLDELGWLPQDLNAWVRCVGCAKDGKDLMVMKYPVTNAQYERFVLTKGYDNRKLWSKEGWQWRQGNFSFTWNRTDQPDFQDDARFGQERRGYPVVGICWYEAMAFCHWLTDLLHQAQMNNAELAEEDRASVVDLLAAEAAEVRLPTEKEWAAMVGGVKDKGRYPWNQPHGLVASDAETILARANTSEAGLKGTTPVAMYPLGKSVPFELMDMAGNIWEWTVSLQESGDPIAVLRGGSWYESRDFARCAYRRRVSPSYSNRSVGFRCVSSTRYSSR